MWSLLIPVVVAFHCSSKSGRHSFRNFLQTFCLNPHDHTSNVWLNLTRGDIDSIDGPQHGVIAVVPRVLSLQESIKHIHNRHPSSPISQYCSGPPFFNQSCLRAAFPNFLTQRASAGCSSTARGATLRLLEMCAAVMLPQSGRCSCAPN